MPCARWASFAYRAPIDPNQGQDANRTNRRRAKPLRRNGRRDRNGPRIRTQQPASLRRVRILRTFQARACARRRRLPALELSLVAARPRRRACVNLESWTCPVPLFDIVNVQNWPAAPARGASAKGRHPAAPRPFVSFAPLAQWQSSPLVTGRSQVRSRARSPRQNAPVAQPVGGSSLRKSAVQVRILLGAPFLRPLPIRPCSPTGAFSGKVGTGLP